MSANRLCKDFGVFRAATHFFTVDIAPDGGEMFAPTEYALSRWGTDSLSGPAVVGLAARCLERDFGVEGFTPAQIGRAHV